MKLPRAKKVVQQRVRQIEIFFTVDERTGSFNVSFLPAIRICGFFARWFIRITARPRLSDRNGGHFVRIIERDYVLTKRRTIIRCINKATLASKNWSIVLTKSRSLFGSSPLFFSIRYSTFRDRLITSCNIYAIRFCVSSERDELNDCAWLRLLNRPEFMQNERNETARRKCHKYRTTKLIPKYQTVHSSLSKRVRISMKIG